MMRSLSSRIRVWSAFALLSIAGCGGHGTELTFNNGQLFYTSAVDRAQAEKVGNYLVEKGFFDGSRITVQLDKKDMIYLFRLVMSDEREAHSPKNLERFRNVARRLANDAFDGQSVIVHLCDKNLKMLAVADPADAALPGTGPDF